MASEPCKCISYNRPLPYQTEQSVVLDVPDWVGSEKLTVCVDACIAPVVKALWEARIWTLGSCCGHNGEFPRTIIVDRSDRKRAEEVIASLGDSAIIQAWELVGPDHEVTIATLRAERDEARELAQLFSQADRKPDWIARAEAAEASLAEVRKGLDLDAAVHAAALTWCGEKERETFLSDVQWFENNWRALPGLTAYVDREIGRRARTALARLDTEKK